MSTLDQRAAAADALESLREINRATPPPGAPGVCWDGWGGMRVNHSERLALDIVFFLLAQVADGKR